MHLFQFLLFYVFFQVKAENETAIEFEDIPNDDSFLHIALYQLRDDLDHKLPEIFPELNASMAKLSGNIDYCYDQTVGNETVNIFTEEMAIVAFKFFVSLFFKFKFSVKMFIFNPKILNKYFF